MYSGKSIFSIIFNIIVNIFSNRDTEGNQNSYNLSNQNFKDILSFHLFIKVNSNIKKIFKSIIDAVSIY